MTDGTALGRLRWSVACFVAAVLVGVSAACAVPLAGGANGDDTPAPMRLVIGLDLSKSNPLVDSEPYAQSVADLVGSEIQDLPLASIVMLRTFGAYSAASNNLKIDRRLSVDGDERPEAVASLMSEIIAGVPKLVRDGTLEAQDSTNIVSFLESMSEFVDCSETDARIILVSDGLEDSDYAHLADPDESLPPPGRIYAGCSELEILGLGQGQKDPRVTQRLRSEWRAWARSAGFKDFTGLDNW
jgi:hypothetical protein